MSVLRNIKFGAALALPISTFWSTQDSPQFGSPTLTHPHTAGFLEQGLVQSPALAISTWPLVSQAGGRKAKTCLSSTARWRHLSEDQKEWWMNSTMRARSPSQS